MKRFIILLVLIVTSTLASSGEEIFQKKCVSCHAKTMTNMQDSSMKAPPMFIVSMRVKNTTASKEKFIAFVNDYIQHPSQDKGVCMPMAYQRFGFMPPIGKKMTKKERETVASWLYESFEGSWNDSMDKGNMRCGSGKCAGGKCGGSQKSYMKCGAGKCGSR